jgi:hypothetical protein
MLEVYTKEEVQKVKDDGRTYVIAVLPTMKAGRLSL